MFFCEETIADGKVEEYTKINFKTTREVPSQI